MDLSVNWLEKSTVLDIQNEMNKGGLTSYELVLFYLDRISKHNHSEANLNAVIEVNPEAIHIAEALDHERKHKGPRSTLHGIPVLLKDNINTGDQMHTSAGSIALKDSYAPEDSTVARKLREAGAVILGKTNLTEWANFMTENMPNGYSSRGGQVLNPYGPGKFDTGGSSAGSGAAIAAHFATLAIGTETSGSILSPSSENSLVGIKPTVGLVSRYGIIPISISQDTAGPMTKSVTDAAHLLNAISGECENDPATKTQPQHKEDYTEYLDKNGLKGKRLGIAPDQYFSHLSEVKKGLIEKAMKDLKDAGAELVELSSISPIEEAKEWDINVMLYEFKANLNHYLSTLNPIVPVKSLKDVIVYNKAHSEQALKYGQTILTASEETSGTLTDSEYLESKVNDLRLSREEGIDHIMKENQLDAIVFPANYGAGIPAKAGYPSITVPCGYTPEGQPLGVTFTGMAYQERQLIEIAYAYEQATKHRVAPELLKSIATS